MPPSGPSGASSSGVFNWASVVVAAGAIAAAAFDTLGTVIPALAAGPVRMLAILGWFAMLVAVNARGAHVGARFAAVATSIKVVPVLIFVIVGIWFITPTNLTLPLAAGHADIGRAAILGIFLFTGAETGLSICGEVRDPARNVPRALIGAIFAYALVCIAVQVVAQGLLGNALGASEAPLADGMRLVSPGLGGLLLAGTVISMLGWTFADALASPRMLFAMSRDGILPTPLGRLTERSRVPLLACVAHAGIAAGLAITGSFESVGGGLDAILHRGLLHRHRRGAETARRRHRARRAGGAHSGPAADRGVRPCRHDLGDGAIDPQRVSGLHRGGGRCRSLLYRFRRQPAQPPLAAS